MSNLVIENNYAKCWIYNYLNKEYDSQKYDCWMHFIEVQKEVFGVEGFEQLKGIEEFEDHKEAVDYIKSQNILKLWKPVYQPHGIVKAKEGDAIVFGMGNSATHIGTYVDSNRHKGVLHCSKKHGVILTNMQNIRLQSKYLVYRIEENI